jgi:site-specific DNA-methyltransferase (adenine-specific)
MTPYYNSDGITIYCGDCLQVMPELEPEFDAIIADLPYGTTACSWDSVIPLDALWVEYKRLIKRRGAVVLTGSQPFTSKLVMSNLEWFRYEWIWDKRKVTRFLDANRRPLNHIESVLVFGEKLPVYNPQMVNGKPHKRGRKPHETKTGVYGDYKNMISHGNTKYYPKQLITISAVPNGQQHPTQKPVDLMAYLIRTYTNPGEIILDNTMGSGTTLVAAQQEGRRAVGIEMDEDYCKIAVERLRQRSLMQVANVA